MRKPAIFLVGKRPVCLWDPDRDVRNREFLSSIDWRYFEYIADVNQQYLDGTHAHRAAAALRVAYHHGLETLFLCLCALVQAPNSVYAWAALCQPKELRALVNRITEEKRLFKLIKIQKATWGSIADLLFDHIDAPEQEKDQIKSDYTKLWVAFAKEFTDPVNLGEYNSIKHGMRFSAGGFRISIKPDPSKVSKSAQDLLENIPGSDFGCSYFRVIPFCSGPEKNTNVGVSSERIFSNWDVRQMTYALYAISYSLQNAVSYLRLINGDDPGTLSFKGFQEPEIAKRAHLQMSGVSNMVEKRVIGPEQVPRITAEHVLRSLRPYV